LKKLFRRKLRKIAENCDHNIDPRCFARQRKIKFKAIFSQVKFSPNYWEIFLRKKVCARTIGPTTIMNNAHGGVAQWALRWPQELGDPGLNPARE
jgi:hypothetical protein